MSGVASKQRPPDDVRSRRIGWRAAGRLVDGLDGGPGTEDLRTLITLASVPMYATTAHTGSTERNAASDDIALLRNALRDEAAAPGAPPRPDATLSDAPLPAALLAAFRASAAGTPTTTVEAPAVRRPSSTRAVVLRFGAAVLVVCGAGTAAASVGVLPAGAQRIAHEYLGLGRVPAPSTHLPSSSAATSHTSARSSGQAGTTPTTGAVSTSTVIALCRQVPEDDGDWRGDFSAADQATLIAAAGSDKKVRTYCEQLLENTSSSTAPKEKPTPTKSPAPSPKPTPGKPSPTPKAKATPTHGGHAPASAPASVPVLVRPSSSAADSH